MLRRSTAFPFIAIMMAHNSLRFASSSSHADEPQPREQQQKPKHKLFSSKAFTYRVFYNNEEQDGQYDTNKDNNSQQQQQRDVMDEIDYEEKIMNCFESLGICPTTNVSAIKTAYRMRALETHPDLVGGGKKNGEGTSSSSSSTSNFLQLQDSMQTCLLWARTSEYSSSSSSKLQKNTSSSDDLFDTLRAKKRITNAIRFKDSESRAKLLKHHASLLKEMMILLEPFYWAEEEDANSVNTTTSAKSTEQDKEVQEEENSSQLLLLKKKNQMKGIIRSHLIDSPISEIEALSNFIQIYLDAHQNLFYFHQNLLQCYGFRGIDLSSKSLKNNNSNNNKKREEQQLSFMDELELELSQDFLREHFTCFTEDIGEGSATEIENFFKDAILTEFSQICAERLRKLKLQHHKETERVADKVMDIFTKELLFIIKQQQQQKTTINDGEDDTTTASRVFQRNGTSEEEAPTRKRHNIRKMKRIQTEEQEGENPPTTTLTDQHLQLSDRLKTRLSSVLDLITPNSVVWNDMMMIHDRNIERISLFDFNDPDKKKKSGEEESDTDEEEDLFDDEHHISQSKFSMNLFNRRKIRSKTILGSQVARIIRQRGYPRFAEVVDEFCIESHETALARNDYHLDALVRDLIDATAAAAATGDVLRGGKSTITPNNHNTNSKEELVKTVVKELDESTTAEIMSRLPKDLKSYRQVHRIA